MIALLVLLAQPPLADALVVPEGRTEALRAVFSLDAIELKAARGSSLTSAVAGVVADEEATFEDRVLAVRVAALLGRCGRTLTLRHLCRTVPGGEGAVAAQKGLLLALDTPEAIALAREAARALRQLGSPALGVAAGALDPEVRAMAAAAGVAADRLCPALGGDAWPQVRAAAARGLAEHPELAECLGAAFADADPTVALAAIEAAGRVALPALRGPLRKVAGDAKAVVPLRAAAFLALARGGDAEPARRALATHLETGKIEPLAVAAVRALAASGDLERLRAAAGSDSERVKRVAERALAAAEPPASQPQAPDPADADPE